jgi:hypothetical protein
LAQASGLRRAVDQSSYHAGGLVQHIEGISIECGLQGSDDAARNARELTRRILQREGYINGETQTERSDPTVYEVYEEIERPDGGNIEAVADNFAQIDAGDPLYRVDGKPVEATDRVWPVLFSANECTDSLGFASTKRGPLLSY